MAHTDDYISSILALRKSNVAFEANPILRLARNPVQFFIFKFSLASLIILIVMIFPPLTFLIIVDTCVEVAVAFNNIYAIFRLSKN